MYVEYDSTYLHILWRELCKGVDLCGWRETGSKSDLTPNEPHPSRVVMRPQPSPGMSDGVEEAVHPGQTSSIGPCEDQEGLRVDCEAVEKGEKGERMTEEEERMMKWIKSYSGITDEVGGNVDDDEVDRDDEGEIVRREVNGLFGCCTNDEDEEKGKQNERGKDADSGSGRENKDNESKDDLDKNVEVNNGQIESGLETSDEEQPVRESQYQRGISAHARFVYFV